MKKRSNLSIMFRLSALVKPLAGFMVLAIIMGVIGNLCAAFITVLGGYAILDALNIQRDFQCSQPLYLPVYLHFCVVF